MRARSLLELEPKGYGHTHAHAHTHTLLTTTAECGVIPHERRRGRRHGIYAGGPGAASVDTDARMCARCRRGGFAITPIRIGKHGPPEEPWPAAGKNMRAFQGRVK